MKPIAWAFDAIIRWSDFPSGSDDPGVWVAGTTTMNQVSQGLTPHDAMESLKFCLAAGARWELAHGRSEHDLFRVRRSNDIPVDTFCERFDEKRVDSIAEVAERGTRYIVAGTVTLAEIMAYTLTKIEPAA